MGMNLTREPYFQREDANKESLRWNEYIDGLRNDGFTVAGGPNQWSVLGPNEAPAPAPSAQDIAQAEGGAQVTQGLSDQAGNG